MKTISRDLLNKAITYEQFAEQIKPYYDTLFEYAGSIADNELFESIIIQHGEVIAGLRVHNVKVRIPPQRHGSLAYKLLIDGKFENEYAMKMLSCMDGKPVVFDVGANFGYYSLLAAKTYPKSQIHSFEPIPDTYSDLCENIRVNNLKNVTANQLAVSNETNLENSGGGGVCSIPQSNPAPPVSRI
jgi:hypothetical protein